MQNFKGQEFCRECTFTIAYHQHSISAIGFDCVRFQIYEKINMTEGCHEPMNNQISLQIIVVCESRAWN